MQFPSSSSRPSLLIPSFFLIFSFSLFPQLPSRSLARNCSCSHQQTAARAKKLAKKLRGENRRGRARQDNGPQPGRFLLILRWKLDGIRFRASPVVRLHRGFSRKPLPLAPFPPSSNFLSPVRRSTEARKHFVADRRAGLIRLRRENFRIRAGVWASDYKNTRNATDLPLHTG